MSTEIPGRELSPAERVDDIPRTLKALREAAREAMLQHKKDGDPIVIWRDGQVVWLPPEDIPDDWPED